MMCGGGGNSRYLHSTVILCAPLLQFTLLNPYSHSLFTPTSSSLTFLFLLIFTYILINPISLSIHLPFPVQTPTTSGCKNQYSDLGRRQGEGQVRNFFLPPTLPFISHSFTLSLSHIHPHTRRAHTFTEQKFTMRATSNSWEKQRSIANRQRKLLILPCWTLLGKVVYNNPKLMAEKTS